MRQDSTMTTATLPADGPARRQARNTRNIGLATFGVMGLVSSYIIWTALKGSSAQAVWVTGAIALVGLAAALLAQAGRPRWGAWLLIGAVLALTVVGPLTSTNQGAIYAVASLVIVTSIAAATLPAGWVGRLILPSLIAALLAVIVDTFGPAGRPASGDPAGTVVLTGLILLVYAFILATQFAQFPLSVKLVMTFVLVSVVAASAVAFFANRSIRAELVQNSVSSLRNVTSLRATAIGDLLVRQVDLLRGGLSLNRSVQTEVQIANLSYLGRAAADVQAELLARDEQWRQAADRDTLIQSRLADELSDELRKLQASFSDHIELFVTDEHGALIASTVRTSDYYQADEAWWQSAWNQGAGAIYIGQPEFDDNMRADALAIAVPIYDPASSRAIGVLRSTYRLTALNRILFLGEAANSQVDIFFPNAQHISEVGWLEDTDPEVAAQLAATSGLPYAEWVYEGDASFVVQTPVLASAREAYVTNLGWSAIGHVHAEAALAPAEAQTRGLVLVTALVTTLAAIGAAVLAQFLTAPIARLTAAAEKLAAGDLTVQAPVTANDEIGVLARAFNQMVAQLRDLVGTLERRVEARTRALATSTEVSRRLSAVLDPQQLVKEVVEQVRDAFNYYHAHIYLFDDARANLVMVGGTGEAGRVMLARGHQLPAGRGLVGRAAATGDVVLVSDTAADPGWLPNRLLPDTRSEVAVPIVVAGEVIGVLDVQQTTAGALTRADADLLQSIATQVGVALRNAQAYERAERQIQREAVLNTVNQKLQAATTVEQVLKVTVDELGQALNAQRARAQVRVRARSANNGHHQ